MLISSHQHQLSTSLSVGFPLIMIDKCLEILSHNVAHTFSFYCFNSQLLRYKFVFMHWTFTVPNVSERRCLSQKLCMFLRGMLLCACSEKLMAGNEPDFTFSPQGMKRVAVWSFGRGDKGGLNARPTLSLLGIEFRPRDIQFRFRISSGIPALNFTRGGDLYEWECLSTFNL